MATAATIAVDSFGEGTDRPVLATSDPSHPERGLRLAGGPSVLSHALARELDPEGDLTPPVQPGAQGYACDARNFLRFRAREHADVEVAD